MPPTHVMMDPAVRWWEVPRPTFWQHCDGCKMWKKTMGVEGGTDLSPLRLRGGGDPSENSSEEEETPFTRFEGLAEDEMKIVEEGVIALNGPNVGVNLYSYIEDTMIEFLDPAKSRFSKEIHGRVMANVIKETASSLREDLEKMKKQRMEDERKIRELEDKIRGYVNKNKKKDVSIQVQKDSQQQMELGEEEEGKEGILEKLDEILARVKGIEEKEKKGRTSSVEMEGDTTTSWSKVIGRKEKNQNIQEGRNKEEEKRDKNKNSQDRRDREEEKRDRDKDKEEGTMDRRKISLQALKRRLPKGAGVLLELRGGTQEEYQKVLRKCQEKISLDELGIPPMGLRKARGGGILLEVRCQNNEEEKEKQLAERVKEVVGSVERARVRCPLRRLRLKLSGLPFNAVASEIAEAVAGLGRGRADSVRVGPLRTSWRIRSGAGTAWAVCPVEMAVRAAEAAELTLGWARVWVTLERGGGPPSATAAWHVGT